MTRKQFKKEVIDYIKYLINEDSEYPFEAWVSNEEKMCRDNENEFAEISYHAMHLAELVENIQF